MFAVFAVFVVFAVFAVFAVFYLDKRSMYNSDKHQAKQEPLDAP